MITEETQSGSACSASGAWGKVGEIQTHTQRQSNRFTVIHIGPQMCTKTRTHMQIPTQSSTHTHKQDIVRVIHTHTLVYENKYTDTCPVPTHAHKDIHTDAHTHTDKTDRQTHTCVHRQMHTNTHTLPIYTHTPHIHTISSTYTHTHTHTVYTYTKVDTHKYTCTHMILSLQMLLW